MPSAFHSTQAKLEDCEQHGPGSGAELLLVEGDSAMASVVAVRQSQQQAVLALQGKPLNAWACKAAKVQQHAPFQALAQALGLAKPTELDAAALAQLRFDRLLLLLDPDADGIHIGALLVLYVQRWLPLLISNNRLWMVRAPMYELACEVSGEVRHADNPLQCQALITRLAAAAGGQRPRVLTHRGLGSIAPEVLRERCVDPATRQARPVQAAEVAAVIEVFGKGLCV